MIAYLDTCTILNLIQVNYDDEYLKYLIISFDEIKLTEVVYDELKTNRHENIIDYSHKELLDSIIFSQIKGFVDYSNSSDAVNFTKKHTLQSFKENGESYSVSYSLNDSRYGDDYGNNLLKTHFITDDAPAKVDFEEFYRVNVIGQILDTIDVMTIFWLKQFITKNELKRYCYSLKQLYCKDIGVLLTQLKDHSRKFTDALTSKQKILITKLIEMLSDVNEDTKEELSTLLKNTDLKEVLKKNNNWLKLISNIQKSNFKKKIPYINKRIKDLDKVWGLN